MFKDWAKSSSSSLSIDPPNNMAIQKINETICENVDLYFHWKKIVGALVWVLVVPFLSA